MSDDFTAVHELADLPPGKMARVQLDRVPVMLANVDGEIYALRDVCGHRNAPLSRGTLEGCQVECPLHFALFDVRDGHFIDGPLSADIPTYAVKVEAGTIYVKP
ncbi:MAG TPA: non-heme iron oxygenase ferredoxin subunit [Stellaceae bacterium]|jgi:nitrite reductase/ring-hydroxylating ferredoxin subunit